MAIAKTTKPAVKKPVKAAAVKKGKFYYSTLRRLPDEDIPLEDTPLEDPVVWGPFDSHEAVVKDYEENSYGVDETGVDLIVFENATILSLKEDRKVVVTKTVL